MNRLKHCPFCGGKATLVEYWLKGVANKRHYFVQCKSCGIRKDSHHSGYNSASKAIRAWNKRANGEKTDEVEEMKDIGLNEFKNNIYQYIATNKNEDANFLSGLETAVVIAEKMAGVYERIEE